MPAASASFGSRIRTSRPSRTMLPASGSTTPARIFIRVDLPAPFSPTRACAAPGSSASETPSRAMLLPNAFATPDISRSLPTCVPPRPSSSKSCALRPGACNGAARCGLPPGRRWRLPGGSRRRRRLPAAVVLLQVFLAQAGREPDIRREIRAIDLLHLLQVPAVRPVDIALVQRRAFQEGDGGADPGGALLRPVLGGDRLEAVVDPLAEEAVIAFAGDRRGSARRTA